MIYLLLSITIWRCCSYWNSSIYFIFNPFKVAFLSKFLLIHYLILYKLLRLAPKVKHTASSSQDNRQYWPQKQKRAILINTHAKCVLVHIMNGGQSRINRLVPVFKWLTLVWFVSSICLLVQGWINQIEPPKEAHITSLCVLWIY